MITLSPRLVRARRIDPPDRLQPVTRDVAVLGVRVAFFSAGVGEGLIAGGEVGAGGGGAFGATLRQRNLMTRKGASEV